MGNTNNIYLYAEAPPIDAMLEVITKAISRVAGTADHKVRSHMVDPRSGIFYLNFVDEFSENREERTLTIHTRGRHSLPTQEDMDEDGVSIQHGFQDREYYGSVITIGAHGRADEITEAVSKALGVFGPVLRRDENAPGEPLTEAPRYESLSEYMEDMNYSLYEAENLMHSMRSLLSTDELDILQRIDEITPEEVPTKDFVKNGSFRQIIMEPDESPSP